MFKYGLGWVREDEEDDEQIDGTKRKSRPRTTKTWLNKVEEDSGKIDR